MRHLLSSVMLAGLVASAVAVQPAMAGVCLTVKDIKSSDVAKDGTSITFEMRNGKIYRNELAGKCPDAWFNGFAWTIHADTVCDDEPGLRVINSGEVCHLGKFTEMTPAP